jgi:hypothetical protein
MSIWGREKLGRWGCGLFCGKRFGEEFRGWGSCPLERWRTVGTWIFFKGVYPRVKFV